MWCSRVLNEDNLSPLQRLDKESKGNSRGSKNETKEIMYDTEAGKIRKNFKQKWTGKGRIRR